MTIQHLLLATSELGYVNNNLWSVANGLKRKIGFLTKGHEYEELLELILENDPHCDKHILLTICLVPKSVDEMNYYINTVPNISIQSPIIIATNNIRFWTDYVEKESYQNNEHLMAVNHLQALLESHGHAKRFIHLQKVQCENGYFLK